MRGGTLQKRLYAGHQPVTNIDHPVPIKDQPVKFIKNVNQAVTRAARPGGEPDRDAPAGVVGAARVGGGAARAAWDPDAGIRKPLRGAGGAAGGAGRDGGGGGAPGQDGGAGGAALGAAEGLPGHPEIRDPGPHRGERAARRWLPPGRRGDGEPGRHDG